MNDKMLEIFNINLRIRVNKILYEEKEISLEVYQKMENYLILKLAKLNQ